MSHCRVNGTKAPSSVSGQDREKTARGFLQDLTCSLWLAGWLALAVDFSYTRAISQVYPWAFSLASYPP